MTQPDKCQARVNKWVSEWVKRVSKQVPEEMHKHDHLPGGQEAGPPASDTQSWVGVHPCKALLTMHLQYKRVREAKRKHKIRRGSV